jgi:hypothetical protein
MLIRIRYKPISKVQATLMLKSPNNVKKLKALPWNIILTCKRSVANAGPSLIEESVEKCQLVNSI